MTITDSIIIKAPIEDVFEVFSDLSGITERIPAITNIEVLEGPVQMAVGTTWRETRVMFGKEASETIEVTELEPNAYYATLAESHGARYETSYRFEPVAVGTKVTLEFVGTPLSLGAKLMTPIMALMKQSTKKAFMDDMLALKEYVEVMRG